MVFYLEFTKGVHRFPLSSHTRKSKVIAKLSNDVVPESNAMIEAQSEGDMTPDKFTCASFSLHGPVEVHVVERLLFSSHTRKSKETAKSSNDVLREFNEVREAQKRGRPSSP